MVDYTKYYRAYKYMQELLQNDFTYNYIQENLKDGDKGNDTLVGKTNEKVIDMEWVEAIEETLPYIEKAIDQQRRFIKQIENVVKVELARKTGPESVKHLSQHTNFIAKIEKDNVIPNKLLVTEREESFAIYENRFLMTLIRRTLKFVADKYSKMKDVPDDSYNDFTAERHITLYEEKVDFNFKYVREAHESLAEDLDAVADTEELSDFDRIRKIREKLNSFLATPLMQAISKEIEVRPPITQTNMLKKDPNFKKSVDLWNFLDKYQKPGFEIVSEEFEGAMSDQVQQDVYFTMGFEHFMMNIATNPALRRLLQEKYEEENARIAAEEAKPEKTREAVLKAQLDAVRKEEMAIRLKEIRERDKIINDLTNEVRTLKAQLEQKEKQIAALKATVAALEDQIKQLKDELQITKLKLIEAEKKIAQLEEENAQLKAKIEELEAHIEELNNTIEELNKQIAILNDRIQVLLQENAAQKAKIEEQEKIIEEQTARIADLEAQVAEQLAKITALTEHIQKCEDKIAEDERQIQDLTQRNEQLVQTLQDTREEAKRREEQMNADFTAREKAAAEKHAAEIKSMTKTIEDADAAHAKQVADMNAEFAEKTSLAEQKRVNDLSAQQKEFENQISKIKKSNDNAAAAASAKHAAEVKKVQKSVDKRVAEVEKAAEKRYNNKAKEIQKNADERIKNAEKRAADSSSLAHEKVKAMKGISDLVNRDYAFGGTAVITALAQQLAQKGDANIGDRLGNAAKSLSSLSVSRTKKGVLLIRCTQSGIKAEKLFRKSTDLSAGLNDIITEVKGLGDLPVSVTFSGVDRAIVESYAEQIAQAGVSDVSVYHNKSLKSSGMIAVYFCKG